MPDTLPTVLHTFFCAYSIARQPWFFPVQVAAILGLLWLHQHGYLQVPVTVCDWARLGK